MRDRRGGLEGHRVPLSQPVGRISERVAAIAESATLAVDAKAKALKAAGEPVIGFGAGEPDFPTPAHIVEAAVEACRNPAMHRYTPAAGLPELREAIAAKTMRDSGVEVAAGQVLVTNGGKHAVYAAFQTLLDPGDEVLLPAPVLDDLPGGHRPHRRPHRRGPHRRDHRLPGHRRPARGRPHRRAPRRSCSCRRRTPPARCTRPTRSRPSAAGRSSTASG